MPSYDKVVYLLHETVLLKREFVLVDETMTQAFGACVVSAIIGVQCALREGNTICSRTFDGLQVQLLGDLGSGKTTLVRTILRSLGHRGPVRSPTYTLVEPYTIETPDGELILYHFDLYRFTNFAEWADVGFREYFDSRTICFIEWPQRAGSLLGKPDLVFSLNVNNKKNDSRILMARAYSAIGKTCLERF